MTNQNFKSAAKDVPFLIQILAAWSWRLLIIGTAFFALAYWLGKFATVSVPIAIAIILAAILQAPVNWLVKHKIPKLIAVISTIITTLTFTVGLITFAYYQIIADSQLLYKKSLASVNSFQNWLESGLFHIKSEQLVQISNSLKHYINEHQSVIAVLAIKFLSSIEAIATGMILAIFTLIFFLYEGDTIWKYCIKLVPVQYQQLVYVAGKRGFKTLVNYSRATVIVAAIDGIGVGIGLAIINIPMAAALGSMVFIGAFIPIVGALLSGCIAILIALITKGVALAIITLVIVIAVLQIESHILQPFLMGKSVNLHPLAIILVITLGINQTGIIGGLLSVPIVAFLNTFIKYIKNNYAQISNINNS